MTQKQRSEIRERCETAHDAINTPEVYEALRAFGVLIQIDDSNNDILALLDELDETWRMVKGLDCEAQEWADQHEEEKQKRYRAEEACDRWRDTAKGAEVCVKIMTEAKLEAEIDRDHHKARGKALEMAAHGVCEFCVHENEVAEREDSPCYEYSLRGIRSGYFSRCEHWEFDDVRFMES